MGKINFSVITICFNAENCIEKTINSVLAQKYEDYEYIIWDGKSLDHTWDIIKRNKSRFDNKNISYKFVSENDTGIYDAMNKSLKLASGEWILFLNAGDMLYNPMVLQRVSKYCSSSYDVIYGNVINCYYGIKEKSIAEDITAIKKHMCFNHQATFTNKDLFRKYKYNKVYKMAADYDLYLNAYLHGARFLYIPIVVSYFDIDGISYRYSYERELEFLRIRRRKKLITNSQKMWLKLLIIKFKIVDIGKRIVGRKNVIIYKKLKQHFRNG